MANLKKTPARFDSHKGRRCLSCGSSLAGARRRYCGIECRQNLRRKLNARTGLLKALNTRYASFYFTDAVIVMDILPYNAKEIFSFIYPRTEKSPPAQDFCRMSDTLGNAWWAERKRTNKKYLANIHVLNHANRGGRQVDSVSPVEIRMPSVRGKALIRLRLGRKDLELKEIHKRIKTAFRAQAMILHPDKGGNNAAFRKLVHAYEELISWAESPSFITRRGFPDKWFYDGSRNRWVQPTPEPKR